MSDDSTYGPVPLSRGVRWSQRVKSFAIGGKLSAGWRLLFYIGSEVVELQIPVSSEEEFVAERVPEFPWHGRTRGFEEEKEVWVYSNWKEKSTLRAFRLWPGYTIKHRWADTDLIPGWSQQWGGVVGDDYKSITRNRIKSIRVREDGTYDPGSIVWGGPFLGAGGTWKYEGEVTAKTAALQGSGFEIPTSEVGTSVYWGSGLGGMNPHVIEGEGLAAKVYLWPEIVRAVPVDWGMKANDAGRSLKSVLEDKFKRAIENYKQENVPDIHVKSLTITGELWGMVRFRTDMVTRNAEVNEGQGNPRSEDADVEFDGVMCRGKLEHSLTGELKVEAHGTRGKRSWRWDGLLEIMGGDPRFNGASLNSAWTLDGKPESEDGWIWPYVVVPPYSNPEMLSCLEQWSDSSFEVSVKELYEKGVLCEVNQEIPRRSFGPIGTYLREELAGVPDANFDGKYGFEVKG